MAFGSPQAYMGFVGYAYFIFPGENVLIRAKSANVMLKQNNETPDVIDGRWDKSLYQLGPQIVEGDVDYPAIMEITGNNVDPTARLYLACIGRETNPTSPNYGRLQNSNLFNLGVLYTTQFANYTYNNCLVNQWKITIAQSATIDIHTNIWGTNRVVGNAVPLSQTTAGFPENSRICTWNDAVVSIQGQNGAPNIDGANIRTFNISIDNKAERYFTLNRQLFPQDITVRKREINGSFQLMGRNPQLGDYAANNQNRCYEDSSIQFGYALNNAACISTFLATMPNIVFQIEEMQLTNEILETTVNFKCVNDQLDLTTSEFLNVGGSVEA